MKKYILTTALLVISYLGFSQVTPASHYRIANRTTAFGINVPVGTQIYCVSDSTTWEVKVGLASTATITTGLSSLFLVGKATNLTVGTVTGTTVNVNSSTGTSVTLPAATTTDAGLMTEADFDKLAAISGTNTGDQTITLTGDATGSGTGSFATVVGKINGVALSGLATGILKNTFTTGVPSIAVAGDFPTLNQNTTGNAATATSATTATNLAGGSGGTIPYQSAAGTTAMLANGTAGKVLTSAGGVLAPTWETPTVGTVTSVTSADGNATVATTTSTPVITIVSAPKLTTPRAINGVDFDGTAPITVTAAAGTLTGTTLNSTVVSSSLTSVGTLATLTVTAPIVGSVTGNAATVTTNANLTGAVTSSGNATTITNNAVTYAKMQAMTANKLLGSGDVGTAVAEITLGTGLSYSGATLNTTGVGSRYKAENFEEAAAGPSTARTYSLANIPATATGITVELNGLPLTVTSQYTLTGLVVAVIIPVYQYDRLTVSYTY
ncbi:MAG: hypothetical protein V4511_13145 [Bacteroidota bacterium]